MMRKPTQLGLVGMVGFACLGLLCSVVMAGLWLRAAKGEGPIGFPKPFDTEPDGPVKALPAEEAARGFRVPDGFQVSVFASEPDVQNPIAMAWDHRGRLWIAENYTYAEGGKRFELGLRDRVLILEDTDGDGRHDKRTVFTDDVQMLSGIEIGQGGVWLLTLPQLVFIPDANGDDKPDGAPIVVLDGFTPSTDNYHTFANGLKWGPDGWLYGRCGASSPGRIGAPGTPDAQRVPLNGGVWRCRVGEGRWSRVDGQWSEERRSNPSKSPPSPSDHQPSTLNHRLFEVLSHGTTNPWGMDWNEHGEAFFINTVIGHLWHVIPGAHFQRPHTEDPNPFVYELIDQHADHYHWDTGKDWSDSRNVTGEHDRLGGGHAHSGAMIYLGDNWPAQYRGQLITLNLHGRRANVERLQRSGSGYVATHQPDMLNAADPWFRGIDLSYGPDGAVYILDWSDTGECHERSGVHRTSGRIYRVIHSKKKASAQKETTATVASDPHRPKDVGALSFKELVALHRHPNEWFVRQGRRVLVEQLGGGNRSPDSASYTATIADLRSLFEKEPDVTLKLRAMWTLFQLGALDEATLLKGTRHPDEHVRTWSVRLLIDACPLDTIFAQPHPQAKAPSAEVTRELIRLAKEDDSGLVRLALSSALQRLPITARVELATPLAARGEDADDHNLPLMVWYGLMPVATRQPLELARFAVECRFPTTRRLIARRLAELIDEQPKAVDELLTRAVNESVLADVLNGLSAGFAGRHKVKAPAGWDGVARRVVSTRNTKLQERVRDLSVLFGDGRALDEVRRVALDNKAEMATRKSALQTLIDSRTPDLRDVCEKLLSVRSLNMVAVKGLASFEDPAIGAKLAKNYRTFYPVERPAVIETLVARPAFARALLAEMAAGKIPRTDLTAFQARQLRSFGDVELTKQLAEVWGELRDSPDDKRQLANQLKSRLTVENLKAADLGAGRAQFNKLCANCHRLYGHGGAIGPDLTGAGRHNLDYVIENLVDPSAVVGIDYRMSTVVMQDGRILNGIVSGKKDRTLTLQTAKEQFTIALSDIEEIKSSALSLMPEGQLQPLKDEEVRDLIGYLMHPTQVPLPSSE